MEFQFSSWNRQGDGKLAKIQVGLPKDSMWIFLIPAGNFQAHGISFSGFIHLECFLIVFKNPPGNSKGQGILGLTKFLSTSIFSKLDFFP